MQGEKVVLLSLCRVLGVCLPFFFFLMQSQKIKCNVATCLPPAAPELRPGPGCLSPPGHLTPWVPRAEQQEERDISASTSSLVNHEHHRTLPSPPRAHGWSPATAHQHKLPSSSAWPVSLEVSFSLLPASICLRQAGKRGSTHTVQAQDPLDSACLPSGSCRGSPSPEQFDIIAWGSTAPAFSC